MLILGRLFLDLFGYLAAVLAASLFMHILALPGLGVVAAHDGDIAAAIMFVTVPFAAIAISMFAFMPAVLAIFVAEAWSLRSWLYFALAGGAIGLVFSSFNWSASFAAVIDFGRDMQIVPRGITASGSGFIGVAMAAGIVGGFVYWLIAGRSSGSWRGREASGSAEQP